MSILSIAIAIMAPVALVVWLYSSAPAIILFWRFWSINRQAAKIASTQAKLARLARQKAVLAHQEAVACLDKREWTASKAVADAFEEAKRMHKLAQIQDEEAQEKLSEAQKNMWGLIRKVGTDNETIVDEAFAAYEAWNKIGVQRQNAWKGAEKAWKRVVWKCE
ncbi:MAG: hypothetical protein MJE68_28015 [Proteobacteria bacterium]|nr:hypothetical protein [Pseudomonadota bacterium]